MFSAPAMSVGTLNEKPTLETVKAAIKTVLSESSGNDRQTASEWLEALKNSFYSWEICDQLLQAHESIEISYLAANMLRQKISRNFNELPLEYYNPLRDSLMNHAQRNEDYAVQGQLTMAIADLTLLLQSWLNPIEDLAKQLGLDVSLMSSVNNDPSTIFKALHNRLIFGDIMRQMCDLNHNHSERPCRIGAKRREQFEDYLISKCGQAISWWLSTIKEIDELRMRLLSDSSTNQDVSMKNQILETTDRLNGQIYLCYSAWLRIFDEENVNESLPLIDAAFRHLREPETSNTIHKYAVEVIVATSNFCEDNRAVDYLIGHLVNQIYSLEQAFRQSVASEDVEKSSNFARTFTSVAETACLIHVIENKDFRLIDLLLSCLSHYDFEVVEETYTFWWIFLDHLQNRLKQSEYGPYKCCINRFVMSVIKLCQFDPDEDAVISSDQDIHDFRANSSEIITNLMFITSVEEFIRDNHVLEGLKTNLSGVSWEKTETILYLINCLVQMTTKHDNHLRVEIFHCIIMQQTNQDIQTLMTNRQVPLKIGVAAGQVHPQIVATTLKILGSMESFFAEYPNYLTLAINYILSSISDPVHRTQLIKYAATALCSIMELNAYRHISSCPEIYQTVFCVKDLCANLDQYDEQAAEELLKCSGFMNEAIPDPNMRDQLLCEIVNPNIIALKNTLNSTDKGESEPIKYLDRLSIIFKHTKIRSSVVQELKNFVSLIDTELWPTILNVLELYASDKGRAIERACRSIRYLLRCTKLEGLIQRVAETMVNLYKTYPQNSSPLYICSILVDEFANISTEINQGLFAMLEIFCTLTFTLLNMDASQSNSLLTMKSYPETIEDMMRLFNRFMKKCPNDFVNCKALESIIELSISSLRIDHSEVNIHVSKFVTSFIALGQNKDYPHIGDAIRNVLGARFTDAVIKASLFDIPSSLISYEAEILAALYSFDQDLFNTWVEATVSSLPKTNIQGIESVTPDQLEEFKNTITTAGSLKKIVNGLRAFARLYT